MTSHDSICQDARSQSLKMGPNLKTTQSCCFRMFVGSVLHVHHRMIQPQDAIASARRNRLLVSQYISEQHRATGSLPSKAFSCSTAKPSQIRNKTIDTEVVYTLGYSTSAGHRNCKSLDFIFDQYIRPFQAGADRLPINPGRDRRVHDRSWIKVRHRICG